MGIFPINENTIKKFKTPEELLKWMDKNVKYGFVDINNKKDLDSYDMSMYKLQSPNEFFNNKVGLCWDQAIFEKYILENQMHIKCTLYFIITDTSDNTTHTFITYKKNNKVYYFENSFELYRGIHEFKNEDEVLLYVINNMKKLEMFKNYELYKITDKIRYGVSDKEFVLFCMSQKRINIKENYLSEKTLSTKERDKLNNSEFGIPELKKYPMPDKNHVLSAIRYFDKCPNGYEKILAKNIIKKAKEFNIDINKDSKYYKLSQEKIIEEENIITNIIQESSKKVHIKTKKKYKCLFCDERYDREHLVYHVERKHPEMIPENYTSARVVFNYINKKDHGSCVVCGQETEWKEDSWKYARLCKNPKCKAVLSKKADENCKKKTGKTPRELLLDPEHQNQMLKGRSISGVYTFQDGGKRDYVGSYEKNILEFYDKFLNKKSDEIQTPGPVIEYMYKGEKHFWITDIYDITANLAIDVKDGGDNPNTREMKDYREKQVAKEKAITEQGKYNYLRLTNNNFEQLIQILSDLKMMMIDDTVQNHTISMINEYTALGGMNPVIGSSGNYIVNYGINGVFTGQAYTTDRALSKVYKIEDGKAKRENTKDFLNKYDFELYEYNDNKNIEIKEGMEIDSFYELITGNKYIDEAQILNDSRFTKTYSFYEYLESTNEVIENSLIQEFNDYLGSPTLCVENNVSESKNEKIKILQNENGYFIKNMISGLRSGYYDSEKDIPLSIKEIIK